MKAIALAILLLLCSCGARQPDGPSYHYAEDKNGVKTTMVRWHIQGRAPTVWVYAEDRDGNIIPLYPFEASAFFSPLWGLMDAVLGSIGAVGATALGL
jgi:hypothetical protein